MLGVAALCWLQSIQAVMVVRASRTSAQVCCHTHASFRLRKSVRSCHSVPAYRACCSPARADSRHTRLETVGFGRLTSCRCAGSAFHPLGGSCQTGASRLLPRRVPLPSLARAGQTRSLPVPRHTNRSRRSNGSTHLAPREYASHPSPSVHSAT